MSEPTKKWYVLRAVAGKEGKIKEYLDNEIQRTDLGQFVSQVLIPTEKITVNRNGKKTTKERSYLPGYVLVEAVLNNEVSGRLRGMPNVLGFLGGNVGTQPIPLRPSEVNRFLKKVDETQDSEEEVVYSYAEGEAVKVIFGPFNGFSGVIEEVNEDKKKLKVMVKIFGRKTPLELSFTQVEKE